MPPIEEKTKLERVKETIRLLKALQANGLSAREAAYLQIKELMTKWVEDGEQAYAEIDLFRQNRVAHVSLPKRADKAATINLMVVRAEE